MKANALGFPLTLDVEGARVVVIGDDEEAERKAALLFEAGAVVERLATFEPAALDGARLVLFAPRDRRLAAEVHAQARARGVLCWACDDPTHSDLAMPAVVKLGAARITIATSGHSPALTGQLRAMLEQGLGATFARFVEALGELRARVQSREPDAARRREELTRALDGFELTVKTKYPSWFRSS